MSSILSLLYRLKILSLKFFLFGENNIIILLIREKYFLKGQKRRKESFLDYLSNGDRHDLSIYPSLFSRDPSLLFDTDFNPCRDFGLTSLYLFLRILTVQYLKDFSSSLSVNHLFSCHSRFVTYAISISLQIFLPVERKRWSSNPSHFLMLRG